MLKYSDDKKYIIQYSPNTGNYIKFGPYNGDFIPKIYNNDKTIRHIRAIPNYQETVWELYPDLRDEFIEFTNDKYKNLTLRDIKQNCNYDAEWECKTCGNRWITSIQHRAKRGQGCKCCDKYKIQFPEKYVYYCLKQVDPNLQENYKILNSQNLEFDMYDPASRIAIEFNGAYHNKDGTDGKKLQLAVSNNINLIRVWQYNNGKKLDLTDKNNYIVPDKSSVNIVPDLNIIIDDICEQYNLNQSLIDRKQAKDQAFIRTNKIPPAGESLLDQYPDLCRDWDYSKNGVIRPEMLYPHQGMRIWWKCSYCGKTWNTWLHARTNKNCSHERGCEVCINKRHKQISEQYKGV